MKANASGRDRRTARLSRNVIALGVVSLFTDMASEMIYPLVPIFVTLLGSGALILGMIEGVAETTAAMLKLASGIVSDRIGKRKALIVAGYALSTLARPFTGAVSAAWQIIFIRMTDRVGKGIRTAPRDALIASSVDERIRGKAFGFHRAMDHAGAVLGPILAVISLILLILVFRMRDALSVLRWTFFAAVVPGVLAVLALVFFVSEKAASVPPAKKMRPPSKPFDRNFIVYLCTIVLFTLGNSSDAFLLFRVQDALHHSPSLYSTVYATPIIGDMVAGFGDPEAQRRLIDILFVLWVWAFFHVVKVALSAPLGALSDRIGRKTVIGTGWAIYAFVYLAFAFLDRLPDRMQIAATLFLFAVYALYYAFSEGAEKAFVADLVKPERRGGAYGWFHFAVGLSAFPASVVFGYLYMRFGAGAAFGTGASIACVSMLLFVLFVKEPPEK